VTRSGSASNGVAVVLKEMTFKCDVELLKMDTSEPEGMFWWKTWLIIIIVKGHDSPLGSRIIALLFI
jgi:hypothetical protein